MKKRILIIGGYGNFGRFITSMLAAETQMQIIVAGRSLEKARAFVAELNPANSIQAIVIDINKNLSESLASLKPHIVIHTSGPFQAQDYSVASACIAQGCHYIDLADGRDFVENITTLNPIAKSKKVLIMSGASSVPCLTSALVDHYQAQFEKLETLDYGITTAQKTTRGLATTASILGYTGKRFKTLVKGKPTNIYGWQHIHLRKYQDLGWRLLGNCDVPDLSLFPKRYPSLKTIRFYAGLEIPFIHTTLWLLSWLVRLGFIKNLQAAAPALLRISFFFDWLGSANSAFHMKLTGKGTDGAHKHLTFQLIARSGDGPFIPCIPAVLLARKLASDELTTIGAHACMGFINLEEYLEALRKMDIVWSEKKRIINNHHPQ